MKYLVLLLLVMQSAGASTWEPGEFYGFRFTNRKFYQNVMNDTAPFDLANYVGSYEISKLLGYQAKGLDGDFRNGTPNSTNMMLWALTMEKISSDFGSVCTANSANKFAEQLDETFLKALLTLCSWPAAGARSSALWEDIWLSFMAYDAPPEELAAWQEFFGGEAYKDATGAEVVKGALLAIFMNPHFLLRK